MSRMAEPVLHMLPDGAWLPPGVSGGETLEKPEELETAVPGTRETEERPMLKRRPPLNRFSGEKVESSTLGDTLKST